MHLDSPITIYCIYLHQSDEITSYCIQHLVKQLPEPHIITGDYNAHNVIWGSTHMDQGGEIIESFLTSIDNLLLNTGRPTRFNSYNGTSAIDLTISSPGIFSSLSWSVSTSLSSREHSPQILDILSCSENQKTLPLKWHFLKANWELYRNILYWTFQLLFPTNQSILYWLQQIKKSNLQPQQLFHIQNQLP